MQHIVLVTVVFHATLVFIFLSFTEYFKVQCDNLLAVTVRIIHGTPNIYITFPTRNLVHCLDLAVELSENRSSISAVGNFLYSFP